MSGNILFRPLRLGSLTLPNRVLMTAVKLGYATPDGQVTERHLAFYARRAEGGVGLMVSEPMYILRNGREIPTQLGIYDDDLIAGLRHLTDAVHEAGGRIMAHINHAGRAANPKLVPEGERVSASAVPCPANGITPRPLTTGEIAEMVDAFAQAARRAREAGFDAVEIPFSHGYLIHQFLSPRSNRREDEYGGSWENRLRFGREVLAAVRQAVGEEFPLVVRMNAQDYVEGGLTLDDALTLAPALEAMGADALSITSGTMCESVPFCLYPTGTPKANLLPMAAAIRRRVGIPLAVAGRIRSPDVAREALAQGQADWIGLGRAFLADPDWVRKAEAGDDEAILLCAACHQGCLAELRQGHGTSCLINPLTGREWKIRITPAEQPRQIMVVGGGPAGLEAALVAARRGHRVTLYEKNSYLGGQFELATRPPHKEDLEDAIRYLAEQARRNGVDIRLNTKVTPQMVEELDPEVVIIATGGEPIIIPFPGLDEARWVTAHALLRGEAKVTTESALVVGGGLVGLETADFLSAQGIRVTVVEMLPSVGGDLDPLPKAMLLKRLKQQGVEIKVNTKVLRLSRDRVTAEQDGREVSFPVETVVMAVGARANHRLADELKGRPNLYVIGDAAEPHKALEAILAGLEVGMSV